MIKGLLKAWTLLRDAPFQQIHQILGLHQKQVTKSFLVISIWE